MSERLKFVPLHSFVDSTFFQKLSELKLDEFKLDTSEQTIYGYYNIKNYAKSQGPIVNLSALSFEKGVSEFCKVLPKGTVLYLPGELTNVNTKEEFQALDKNKLLAEAGAALYDKFKTNEVLNNPLLLAQFKLISYSDLKQFKFYYWFAFPSLHSEWHVKSTRAAGIEGIDEVMGSWLKEAEGAGDRNFFLLDAENRPIKISELVVDDKRNSKVRVGIVDASTYEKVPSWYLRNFLSMLLYYGFNEVEVLVYRVNGTSFFLDVTSSSSLNVVPKIVGWEKTSSGSLQPKIADLKSLLSPTLLADQAVDLNLKLMKWRIIPQIDLEEVKNTKCLLLGAGTLGSYVSRALLGWGVRTVTFVDNGKVSFSNPVRQSLYTFDDCLDGGKPKAEAAAASLRQIFPSVDSKGYNLEIPMIGHAVKDEAKEQEGFELLCKLVDEHDAIFLLMDSRETRWLPTILGNVKQKIVLNAALGFDSYLVMRHGGIADLNQEQERVGCYFCNDVFAPSDSLSDRTLDQMCTVTRPGVALMASGLAVELLISILQHPKRQFASPDDENILGLVPHQIRGFLHNYSNVKLQAPNYKHCSACSLPVLQEFDRSGWQFVKRALANHKYVEDISGLTKVQEEAEKAALEFELQEAEAANGSDEEWF